MAHTVKKYNIFILPNYDNTCLARPEGLNYAQTSNYSTHRRPKRQTYVKTEKLMNCKQYYCSIYIINVCNVKLQWGIILVYHLQTEQRLSLMKL